MPDNRSHRGRHPEDTVLFVPEAGPALRSATGDLCWLLSRGYAVPSALKLVGDRYALKKRQRTAVGRCAASDVAAESRRRRCLEPHDLRRREVWIDGYNVLTSIEAALAGGVILHARDGCFRDIASMHGSYRKVEETVPALNLLGELMAAWPTGTIRWFLDRPASNSGRLKVILLDVAARGEWNWQADLVNDPDAVLATTSEVAATADSGILDRCSSWINLARIVIQERVPTANIVDLSGESSGPDD